MKFYAGSRGRHHFGYGIAPFRVMRRLFVLRRSFRCAVDLDQNETSSIVSLLHDIESRNPRFLNACLCIFNSCQPEGLNVLGLYLDMYMNNQHRVFIHLASLRLGANFIIWRQDLDAGLIK